MRKDTGYSTASSHTSATQTPRSFTKDLVSPTRVKLKPQHSPNYGKKNKSTVIDLSEEDSLVLTISDVSQDESSVIMEKPAKPVPKHTQKHRVKHIRTHSSSDD